MTLPSLRKRPITRPSILRRSPSEPTRRRLICLALAVLLVCVPGGIKSTYAGKKQRDARIDRLRERSPSQRWKLLQRMWHPFSNDSDAADAGEPADPPATPQTNRQSTSRTAGASFSAASATSTATAADRRITESAAELPAEPAVAVWPRPPAPATDSDSGALQQSSGSPGQTASPVWVIDAADPSAATGLKRPAGGTMITSLQADDPAAISEEEMLRQIAREAELKPITDILPYYDYVPEGTTDPEDILCLDGGDDMNCPKLDELPAIGFEERLFVETYVAWEPSNLFCNPLYFEDASLERYGHTHGCLQPLLSLGKFSAQLVGLPYQMALHPVCEHRYALGWYRPGECAPHKYYLPPWNTKAAITAGAAYTGLFFLIP